MNKETAFKNLITPNHNDKILLLTHNDADGSGASIVIKSIFPNVTTKHCTNSNMSYEIKNAVCNESDNYDFIFACDISCNEDDATIIQSDPNHKKLLILDHHITAEHLNKYSWAFIESNIIDDSRLTAYYPNNILGKSSGASLMFDYMDYNGFTKHVKNIYLLIEIVHLIAAYDTWDWVNVFEKDIIFEQFNILFNIYKPDMFEEKMLEHINSSSTSVFDETDKLLLKIENNRINDYLSNIQKSFTTGNMMLAEKYHSIVFCTTDNYLSQTFELMKTQYPDYDIYLINYGTGIALRATKPDINVGKIAKMFGGGGHPGASGLKIPFEYQKELIEKTFSSTLYVDEKTQH